MVSSCVFVFAQLSRRLSRRSSSTAVCRQSDCEKMMAFLSKGGTSSKTIQRLQHEAAAKQAMAGIAKQAAAAGRVAVKAASRALLLADEQQNGADRQANAAAAATAAERAARHMPDHRVVVEEESDSGGGAPKKKRRKSGIKQLTWPVRAVAIFMFLHPQLFNGNVKVASTVFGVSRPAFMAWLKPALRSSRMWSSSVAASCVEYVPRAGKNGEWISPAETSWRCPCGKRALVAGRRSSTSGMIWCRT